MTKYVYIVCRVCEGTGLDETREKCPACNGLGEKEILESELREQYALDSEVDDY